MRRPRSAQGTRSQGSSGRSSPSPIHSGPGQSREFGLTSKFTTQDPLQHGASVEVPFTTFDYSKANKDWHKWQRLDTFQTPTACSGPPTADMEDLSVRRGPCAMRPDLLEGLRDEILEGCRADLHSVVTLVRQEVDRSVRQITGQFKRCLRDQNADSLNLLAELGRVRTAEGELADVLREVQEGRRGEANMLFEGLRTLQGSVEASSQGMESVRSAVSSLAARQGSVEEGVSEVSAAVQRVMAEVAEIRKVKTELEFRNARDKKIEAEVRDTLGEVQELKTSLEASGVFCLAPQLGHLSERLHGAGKREPEASNEGLEAQLRRALVSGDHLAAFRGELREAMRLLAEELDERGGAAVAGAMEGMKSTMQAQLSDVVREVRRIKADVDLKIIREGGTRDIKIFVSTAAREDEGTPEDAHGMAAGVGLAGAAHRVPSKQREGSRTAPSQGPGQSGSWASASTAPGQELSASNWTDPGAATEPAPATASARRGEDPQWPAERPAPRNSSRRSSRASEAGRQGLSEADMAALHAVFERVDVNGSGSISMIETVKALRTDEHFARALGFEGTVWVRQEDGTRDAFVRAFQRVDTNSDTSISWEELLAFAARRGAAGLFVDHAARPPDPGRRSREGSSETSLSHEEEYHGSIIDGHALDRAIRRARGEGTELPPLDSSGRRGSGLGKEEKVALRNMFERVDANGSGQISMAETVKALRVDDAFARVLGFDGPIRVRQEDGTRDAFCRAFQQVDADGDNNITWEELLLFASGQRDRNLGSGAALGDRPGELEDLRR